MPARRPRLDEPAQSGNHLGMPTARTVIPSLAVVKEYVGVPLGASRWVTVGQDRIDAFANATGDDQWIHVDVERAGRETPWKSTIAHGYLTLALVPSLLRELIDIVGGGSIVNTGVEKLRLATAVPAGSRVRLVSEIKTVRELPGGGVRITFGIRVEVEGSEKPALRGSVVYAYLP